MNNQITLNEVLANIYIDLKHIKKKLSMPDSIIQIRNSRFYLPNYPLDLIQNYIAEEENYWDYEALEIIDKYLPDNANIIDAGANIGNHSVYWAVERNANKVYAFEPHKSIYETLVKNIELNNLEKIVIPYNVGFSDEETYASVKVFHNNNIGGTEFQKNKNGNFKLVPLDSIDIKEKIDLLKIDVERHEIEMLMGAVKTISKSKPVIVIETFDYKKEVDAILNELGYVQTDTIRENEDFIYKYAG